MGEGLVGFGVLWRGDAGIEEAQSQWGWPPSPRFLEETLESYKKGGMK